MADSKATPRFVNLQSSPVGIFDEKGNRFMVGCYAMRDRQTNGVFVVEGEYYRKFLHPHGPLRELPEAEKNATFREGQVRTEGDGVDGLALKRAAIENAQAGMYGGKAPPADVEEPEEEDDTPADEPEEAGAGEGADGEGDGAPDAPEEEEEEEGEDVTLEEVRAMNKKDLAAFADANEIDSSGTKAELLARVEKELFTE